MSICQDLVGLEPNSISRGRRLRGSPLPALPPTPALFLLYQPLLEYQPALPPSPSSGSPPSRPRRGLRPAVLPGRFDKKRPEGRVFTRPSGLSFLFLRLISIIKAIIDALYLSAEVIDTILNWFQ